MAPVSEALGYRGLNQPEYLREAIRAELKTIEQFRPDVITGEEIQEDYYTSDHYTTFDLIDFDC
ncbi:hypothetical protein ABZT17_02680 [Streptomyces sp. NPDC005648]|uniref:hypothetical protein n=1 Tax=Streptomyces sp. NPDC005648 TaxID=3157044 RepID=UPI0033B79DE7